MDLKSNTVNTSKNKERRGTGFVFDNTGQENIEKQKAHLLKKFNEISEEAIDEDNSANANNTNKVTTKGEKCDK